MGEAWRGHPGSLATRQRERPREAAEPLVKRLPRPRRREVPVAPASRGTRRRARVVFEVRRIVRGGFGFAVSISVIALLWRGWFHDLRLPGAELGHAAAAAVLTLVLAMKIAAG